MYSWCTRKTVSTKSVLPITYVAELRGGEIHEYTVTPEQFGLQRAPLAGLKVDGAQQSLELIKQLLAGTDSAAADIVALNAGAAIYVAGVASSLAEGVVIAQDVMASGTAGEKLKEMALVTQAMKETQ